MVCQRTPFNRWYLPIVIDIQKKTLSVFLLKVSSLFSSSTCFFNQRCFKNCQKMFVFFAILYHSTWIDLRVSVGSNHISRLKICNVPTTCHGKPRFGIWNQGGWPLEQCNVVAPWRSDHNLYLWGTLGGLGWPLMIIGSNDFLGGGCKMFQIFFLIVIPIPPGNDSIWLIVFNIFQMGWWKTTN